MEPVLFGFDARLLALTVAVLFMGGFIKGVVGLAMPLLIVGVLPSFMPVSTVLAIIIGPILVANLWQAFRTGHAKFVLKRFWPTIAALMIALWFSAGLVVHLDQHALYAMIGIAILLFTVTASIPRVPALPPTWEKWAGPVAGTLGGALGGATAIWAPPVMIFYVMLKMPKDEFVSASAMSWFLAAIPMTIAHTRTGVLTADTSLMSAAACVPVFAGVLLGEAVRTKVNQDLFRKLVLLTTFVIGLNLLRRAIF